MVTDPYESNARCILFLTSESTVYVDEEIGIDNKETAGIETEPFKTLQFAAYHIDTSKRDVTYAFHTRKSPSAGKWVDVSSTAIKKAKKGYEVLQRKAVKEAELAARQNEEEKQREEARKAQEEEAKQITLKQDSSLPPAKAIKLRGAIASRGQRVKVSGWIHRLRSQKGTIFIVLRDGTGYLQCVFTDLLTKTYDALTLTLESSISVYGVISPIPEGKTAPDNHELAADYFEVIGKAPGGEDAFTNKVNKDADAQTKYDQRHLVLRGEQASAVLKVRAGVLRAFRKSYEEIGLMEVTPPCMVQTQVEGGSTLFEFDYYGQKVCAARKPNLHVSNTC